MPRIARFIVALLLTLALLGWAASAVLHATVWEWFERDVSSRAQVALAGAGQSLADAWYGAPEVLQKKLMELTRDERAMGAAACDAELKLRASTPGFPDDFNCWTVGARVRTGDSSGDNAGHFQERSTVASLPTKRSNGTG